MTPGPNLGRGQIWWYESPHAKRRPVLVVTRDEAIPVLKFVLAVPTTTRARGIRSEVRLGLDDGMPSECVLTLDNLQPVHKALLTDHICTLPGEKLDAVCGALKFVLDC